AEEFLRELLAKGEVAATEIKREAQEAGLSWGTIRRAQQRLGIRPARRAQSGDGLGERGRWYWSLPEPQPLRCSSAPYDAHVSDMSTLGNTEQLRRREPTTAPQAPHATRAPNDDWPELPASLRRSPAEQTDYRNPGPGREMAAADDSVEIPAFLRR